MIDPNWFVTKMEEKLVELMGAEEYDRWSTEVAKEAFRKAVDEMPECEFKDFCNSHFDKIVSGAMGVDDEAH